MVADTTEAITELVGDAFLKLAGRIVTQITLVLKERENDAVVLASVELDDFFSGTGAAIG